MPYGISKSLGGDSPANDARTEKQVAAIRRHGLSKISAIKIAKASMHKTPHDHLHAAHAALKGRKR